MFPTLDMEIIHEPVLELLKYNMLLHPSVMIKKEGFCLITILNIKITPVWKIINCGLI